MTTDAEATMLPTKDTLRQPNLLTRKAARGPVGDGVGRVYGKLRGGGGGENERIS